MSYESLLAKCPGVHNIRTQNWQWWRISDIIEKHESCDFGEWEQGLEHKRRDTGYEHLVESIRSIGMLWPVHIDPHDNVYGNGHHRIAACIDLGYEFIPATPDHDACGYGHGEDESKSCYSAVSPGSWDDEIR